MTVKDIVQAIANHHELTYAEANSIVETMFAEIVKGLKLGDKVSTPIGSLCATRLVQRNGRNPRTGATIVIRARNKVKFAAYQNLIDAVN